MGYIEKSKKRFDIADSLNNEENIGGRSDQEIVGKKVEARSIQKEIEEARKKETLWSTLKSVSSKEGRNSFMKFIRSGFKQT